MCKSCTRLRELNSLVLLSRKAENSIGDTSGKNDGGNFLAFESRFESGNLRRAYAVSESEYELVLQVFSFVLSKHPLFFWELFSLGI